SDGGVVYAREPDLPLVPASNQKVLTAAAALSYWGPAHRFVTRIESDRPPDATGVVGELCVRGGGD
ncbi:MAG: D-alanyl-D-alanine carboxypeptidase/D-alanyl-D-alanine-endopeptidase, partial [Akkermansiaceae bacterium]|nr:D-alanyl-D-alanine carboxypeptidase/D-alanyl-D-alanine-endopeptidase [Akkermansiaceae bacterium]